MAEAEGPCGCHHGGMRAEVRSIWLDPHPSMLSADPAGFAFGARLLVGPVDAAGEESLDLTICSPEWLARKAGGDPYSGRHHVVVNVDSFDVAHLESWLREQVHSVAADTWAEVGQRLSRLGYWEFEDYSD